MKKAVNVESDLELAQVLEISSNTISTWKKRNSIPYDHIDTISQKANVSFDWILNGEQRFVVCEPDSDPYVARVVDLLRDLDDATKKRIEDDIQDKKLMIELRRQIGNRKNGGG